MESLASWSAEQGTPLRLRGLGVSDALAQRAREFSPALAGRIHVGDVMTWVPPQRFDYLGIELVYAPPGAGGALVLRCLGSLVADGGRLVVCSYRSTGEDNAADLPTRRRTGVIASPARLRHSVTTAQ